MPMCRQRVGWKVLVDPSFATKSDFPRLASSLAADPANRRPPSTQFGIRLKAAPGCPCQRGRGLRAARALGAEILVGPLNDPNRLNGAAMIVVSPPWTLENKLSALVPAEAAYWAAKARAGFGSPGLSATCPTASQ